MNKQTQNQNHAKSSDEIVKPLGFAKPAGDSIEKFGDRIGHDGVRKLGDAIEHIGENSSVEAAYEMAGEWVSTLTDRAQQFERQVVRVVKNRPFAVLFGALAVGYIASRILTSNSSERTSRK